MKVGISIKLDVTKLDKSRFFKGEKGTYADLTTFVDLDQAGKYGDNGFISQSQTKEERDAKAPNLPILGNVKVFYKDTAPQAPAPQAQAPQAPAPDLDDDVPF